MSIKKQKKRRNAIQSFMYRTYHECNSKISYLYTIKMQKQLFALFIMILIAFSILASRVIYLATVRGDEYTKQILNQDTYHNQSISFKRGDVLDTKGTVLATSIRVYKVILDAKIIVDETNEDRKEKKIENVKKALWDIFEIEPEVVTNYLENAGNRSYIVLDTQVDYATGQELVKLKEENTFLDGIWLEDDYIRVYPYEKLGSAILGFSTASNIGVGGVEQSYNSELNGLDGRMYKYFNDGNTQTIVQEPENGNSIVLTMDQHLQSIVENVVVDFNEEYRDNYVDGLGSKNTAVMITNPNTGAILASVSYPNFDLNNPGDLSEYFTKKEIKNMDEEETSENLNILRRNYTTAMTFEAGSTIKPFTVAAALESGVIDGSETYTCNGSLEIGGYTIRCALRTGHGTINLEESIAYSCNVAMMEMAQKIGVETFTGYQNNFGFGPKTGSDLPDEVATTNLIYTAETMRITDLATNSFGQNFNVTMMQMVAGTGALINGGNYYKPYVVEEIRDNTGRVVSSTLPTLVRKIVSQNTVDAIRDGMRAVVEYGSGKRAAVEGYDIGGKTGTAEKLPRGNGKYLVSFIGGVPIEEPEILIYVLIDEPNVADQANGGFPGILTNKILEEALPYLGITKKQQ